MKKYILFLVILLSGFILGYKNVTAENDLSKPIKHDKTKQKSVLKGVKKQDVPIKKVKAVVKKQSDNLDTDAQKKSGSKPLDLSLPLNTSKTFSTDNTLIQENPDYLPDLFTDKQSNLDIEGKIIRKHEEELHKYETEDGVGVDIKLSN